MNLELINYISFCLLGGWSVFMVVIYEANYYLFKTTLYSALNYLYIIFLMINCSIFLAKINWG